MERLAQLLIAFLSYAYACGQMVLQTGTQLEVDQGTSLRINAPLTWTLEQGSNATNNGMIELGPSTGLNEALGAAITGTGTERTTREFSTPLTNTDAGGLGAGITTSSILGNTTIVRGHVPFTDYSGHSSIARWVDLNPTNNSGLDALLEFRYDPAELNGSIESDQRLHIRAEQDIWWYLGSTVNTSAHVVSTGGLDSLGLFTTFDQDLPNAASEQGKDPGFALLGPAGGHYLLKVPSGVIVRSLEVSSILGVRIACFTPQWTEGLYEFPERKLAAGAYHLRLNGRWSIPFILP